MADAKIIWSGTYAGIPADVRVVNGNPVPFLDGRVTAFVRDVEGILGAAAMDLAAKRDEACGRAARLDLGYREMKDLAESVLEEKRLTRTERDVLRERLAKLEAATASVLEGLDNPSVGPSKGCVDNSCGGDVCAPRRELWAKIETLREIVGGSLNGKA